MSTVYDVNRILMPDVPPDYEDHTADVNYVPAPCQVACPIGTDAPSYIGYIWEGKFEEAFEAITATNPFSSICGRVCDAPCEPACRRTDSDGPLQIRNLKRFVMDKLGSTYEPTPVKATQSKTVAIVGSGPAGLTAAHELCDAGFEVHVYEMTDRLGGMMIWGIPAFRLPPGIIEEDISRLLKRFPDLHIHLNTGLGEQISLDELKSKHDAVLLTIGSWWGKPMGIPGEEGNENVIDGVSFLRRVNAGERPTLPETVVVVGGGDVAMDACRAALRLPGCKNVKVIYRRGPGEIPARKIELEGAIEEGIEFIYFTQQVAVEEQGEKLTLKCVKTKLGEKGEDERCQPEIEEGSEHDIECGMVIAAVGQKGICDDLENHNLMDVDRVRTDWATMRTDDTKVFAAGDGAFGGSTIVMAMQHGQRAAYYVKSFLNDIEIPIPYRTPYRTRRVPVAQDIKWEKFNPHHPEFFGVGDDPVSFPEIEATYDWDTARNEASRCYRCDAETGSPDYSVSHREDIFSMARTNPTDHMKLKSMLHKRLRTRTNPFPKNRAASLDDIVFLPANLSRLVIDPYREACKVTTNLANKLDLHHPFLVTGFDNEAQEIFESMSQGCALSNTPYLGRKKPDDNAPWIQLSTSLEDLDSTASGYVYYLKGDGKPIQLAGDTSEQLVGYAISSAENIEQVITSALENKHDILVLDATGKLDSAESELAATPDFSILRDAISTLRKMKKEEAIELIYYGGVRSGTDTAKLIGLGANAVVLGVCAELAMGGEIQNNKIVYSSNYSESDRVQGLVNIVKANLGEASMMARCTGKTNLYNVEPEDLSAITGKTSIATGIPLPGEST
ncbi:MAG: FAD-dependent oxidoreductase [Gammaproteobacteria bacterium]|nr:FAD-dependent oxidoreductase [Gammaproteobacteria bacterium]